jgi:hypothetical protein
LKQVRDGPLHREPAGGDIVETLENWLPLDHFDNAEWIRKQLVEIFLKKYASEIWEVRENGRQGKT